MKFSTLKSSIITQFKKENGHLVVPFIVGAPGGGKSACAREIAKELQSQFKIPDDRVIEFNPSLRDPADILGIPFRSEDGTHSEWLPPQEFYAIRAGQGPSILILEELSDASMSMQNPLCRVILDRYAGQMKLSEKLFIIATGNRVEDKSGANRLSTKLGNRVRTLQFDSNVDDWMTWAYAHGIQPIITSFIKFRPALLASFDPKVAVNPTPRSWEDVDRIPTELDAETYYEHCKGSVGEGAAAELAAFLRVSKDMPDPQDVIKDPEKATIPERPDVLYAYLGAVETLVSKETADKIMTYAKRLSPEMQTILMIGCFRRYKSIIQAKGFTEWAVANAELLKM